MSILKNLVGRMNKSKTKSPIKEPLLRILGQSIDEEMHRLFSDKMITHLLFAFVFFFLAIFSWIQALNQSQLNPRLISLISIPIISYNVFRVLQTFKEMKRLRLGREGERAVAEQLDILKSQGAVIFHDLLGNGFNIGHVILSCKGIFVIETKTYFKPAKKSASIRFDGKELMINGLKPDRDPIAQVKANARWLGEVLRASTGKEFPIRPVVVFPGWFVEPFPKDSSVWVLNPQALISFIQYEPIRINEGDLHIAAFHLSRYIKGYMKSENWFEK